ncbi:MAG: esterase-like activity of phytase family protein [Fimbriimonadaceae bacterium]
MRAVSLLALMGSLSLAAVAVAQAPQTAPKVDITVFTSTDAGLKDAPYTLKTSQKEMPLTIGIGSGAFRRAGDAPFRFYTVSDRGPNIACGDLEGYGANKEELCKEAPKNGRVYPRPAYSPSIYQVELDPATKTFKLVSVTPAKTKSGKPASGLLNPLTVASTEIPLDGTGAKLSQDANGVDMEGIAVLKDGTMWIGDENGPSLMQLDAEGRIQRRFVPTGTEKDFAAADYETIGSLPALLTKRSLNRGIESLGLSPDEAAVYFLMQNPLANPDAKTYQGAVNARLYKLDRVSGKLLGEWVYPMDPVATYPGEKNPNNSTVRISEMMVLSGDRVVVLERTEKTTRLYEVALTADGNILGSAWDDVATTPSLEATPADNPAAKALKKTIRFDSAAYPEVPVKLEGMALAGDGRLMLINDDDFGIDGGTTKILLVDGTGIKMN